MLQTLLLGLRLIILVLTGYEQVALENVVLVQNAKTSLLLA